MKPKRKRNVYEALWCSDQGVWVWPGCFPCKCHRWLRVPWAIYKLLLGSKVRPYRVRKNGRETTKRKVKA